MPSLIQSAVRSDLLATPEEIQRLAARFGTPLYLVAPRGVVRALDRLRHGLRQQYENSEVTYSVKTNYLSGILRAVLDAGYRLEVVSRRELEHALSAGAPPSRLLFNGPLKTPADLALCRDSGIDVNADSLEELEAAAALANPSAPFRLGVRVAAELRQGAISRFGLDFADSGSVDAMRRLLDAGSIQIAGFHLHHSSRRDALSYCDRLDRLREAADLLGVTPEYLDIGGGLASEPPPVLAARLPYPVDSPDEFAAILGAHASSTLGPDGPRLILEPGIGVLAPAMNYVVSIVSVKPRSRGNAVVVCDGSLFDVNPLRSAIDPPCCLLPREERPPAEIDLRLYGATCMEIDQLGTLEGGSGSPLPRPGDLAVITNVGAYSACLAPDFIIPRAPVYSLDTRELLRPAEPMGGFPGAGA